MYVYLNGKFVRRDKAVVSVTDNGFLYGDGVYETLRTYNGEVWEMDEHLARLEASAKALGILVPVSLRELAENVRVLVKKNGFKESRIRITVTRGCRGFDFSLCGGGGATLLIDVVELVSEPRIVYQKGVAVVTVDCERVLPEVKSINLLPMIIGQREARKAGAYEAIFVSKSGFVREGTITNVFLVKDGVLFTPADGILYGLTREMILKLARSNGVKVKVVNFRKDKLYNADEVFISNSPRKIVPVVKVDGRKVGDGKVGVVTKLLMKAFDEYVGEK